MKRKIVLAVLLCTAGALQSSAGTARAEDGQVRSWIEQADELAAMGRYEAAVNVYKKAILRDSGNQELWRKYNAAFKIAHREAMIQKARDLARLQRIEREKAAQEAAEAAEAEAARKAALADEGGSSGDGAPDGADAPVGPGALGSVPGSGVSTAGGGSGPAAGSGSMPEMTAGAATSSTAGDALAAEKAFERQAASTEPGERVFGPEERIYLPEARRAFDRIGGKKALHDVTVRSGKFEIDGIRIGFDKKGLVVRGRLRNTSGHAFSYPRVYVKVYDGGGTMRGRNFGYVTPGRFVLPSGKSKSFEVLFPSYDATVGSYRFEVVTNL